MTLGKFKEIHTDILESLDELETQEIHHLINIGTITEDDVKEWYNNEWWEDIP